jgi:hypothetical protein
LRGCVSATLHGQAQAIRELASVQPARHVRRACLSAVRRQYRPLTGAAASLTRKAFTPAIASGATACVITSAGKVARFGGSVEQLRATA